MNREFFRLHFRQTEGLGRDLLKGPIDIIVDSTDLEVLGQGKVRQHGTDKPRIWRKIHLAVDPRTHEIVAALTTENSVHDAAAGRCWSMPPALL